MTAASLPPRQRPALDPARSRLVRAARRRLIGAGCLLTFSWVSFDIGEEGARAVLRLVLALVEHAGAAVLLVAALIALARAGRGLGRRRAPRLALALVATGAVLFPLVLRAATPTPSVGPSPGPDGVGVALAVLAALPFFVGGIVVSAWAWPPLTREHRPDGGASAGRRRLRIVAAVGALTTVLGIADRLRMGEVFGAPAADYRIPLGVWQALGLPGFVPLAAWTIIMLAVSARWSRPVQHGLLVRFGETRRGAVALGAALVYLVAASQYLTLFGPFFVYVFVPIPIPDLQLHASPVYGTLAHAALLVAALSPLLPNRSRVAEGPESAPPSSDGIGEAVDVQGRPGTPTDREGGVVSGLHEETESEGGPTRTSDPAGIAGRPRASGEQHATSDLREAA